MSHLTELDARVAQNEKDIAAIKKELGLDEPGTDPAVELPPAE